MDHDLTDQLDAAALPGLVPVLERAADQALHQRAAQAAARVLDGLVNDDDLETHARRAVEHELLDLAEPATPYFPTLPEWVEEWLLPVYRRSTRGHERMWCPEWWRHAEAVARLDALWRAWEHLRLDPATGMSVWFRDHADHHMTVLMSSTGPFQGCDSTHGERPLQPLPCEPAPAGMFQPDDELTPTAPGATPTRAAENNPAPVAPGGRDTAIGRSR